LYEGPSGLFDGQASPDEAHVAEELMDFYEQERINSFENTYNQEFAKDLTYLDAQGGFDFNSNQNRSIRIGERTHQFFDQINNSMHHLNTSNNRMTILDRKNDVRHRFVQGKQMLDMTHPGIVLAGSKNENNLSTSLGDRWDGDEYFGKDVQESAENVQPEAQQ